MNLPTPYPIESVLATIPLHVLGLPARITTFSRLFSNIQRLLGMPDPREEIVSSKNAPDPKAFHTNIGKETCNLVLGEIY